MRWPWGKRDEGWGMRDGRREGNGESGTGNGKKRSSVLARLLRARFDAAQTTRDNARHWGAAEFLSADAEADSDVRKTLRTRARYEVQNNSYARGIVKTLADDAVGTGPRLRISSFP